MSLRLATDAEKRARDAVTHGAWGQGLSRSQFSAREETLRGHRWARSAMRTWLWTGPAAETLASCETFEVASEVGGVRGRSWVVASVFVEPALRRRGHSASMLAALLERLSSESEAQAVTLFSEVGVDLYARLGFFPTPSFDTWFDASPDRPDEVSWLTAPLPSPRPPTPAAQVLHLHLSDGHVDWHLERERFYAAAWNKPALPSHGARVGASSIGWTAYWRSNELHALWLDVVDEAHRLPLVRAAQHAAHEAGIPVVRVWEGTPLGDLPGARRARRDDEIAMFAPLRPGVLGWTHVERGLWA
ncbi:MAG: N-acetyltransferase [Myxococcota bacterium]